MQFFRQALEPRIPQNITEGALKGHSLNVLSGYVFFILLGALVGYMERNQLNENQLNQAPGLRR